MKAQILIFQFRFLCIIDIMFSDKFELKTFRKDGSRKNSTLFDKQEILDKIK